MIDIEGQSILFGFGTLCLDKNNRELMILGLSAARRVERQLNG